MGHSKNTSLRKRDRWVQGKSGKRCHKGRGWCSQNIEVTQSSFSCVFFYANKFFLQTSSSVSHEVPITYCSEQQRKSLIQDAIYAFEVAIFPDPKHYNSSTLSTELLHPCVSISKCVCVHRLN